MYITFMSLKSLERQDKWFFLAWVIVIIISIITLLLFLPKMRNALQESQMPQLIRLHKEKSSVSDSLQKVKISYPFIDLTTGALKSNYYIVDVEKTNLRHNQIEALLKGPTLEAVSDGSIAVINSNTKLIGLTLSNKIVYVNFSKEFLDYNRWDEDYSFRKQLVKQTLLSDSSIKDVVIMVEGEILSSQ